MTYSLNGYQNQISFSGGRTSAYLLYQLKKNNPKFLDNSKVIFTNTGKEMEQTLDFVQECSERWNINVVWLEYDIINNKIYLKKYLTTLHQDMVSLLKKL